MLSTRISIKWSPHSNSLPPPKELTDTLVITSNSSSQGGYFLDLRVYNNLQTNEDLKGKLEWCTAGIKTWLTNSTDEKPKPRASFQAIIDSHSTSTDPPGEEEEALPDEGDFETLPNGDVLETGKMLNPSTNQVESYEEIWRRLKIEKGSWCTILESYDEVGDKEEWKAFLGRIGNDELGMMESKGDREFQFRRIQLQDVDEGAKVIYSSGGDEVDNLLPRIPIEGIQGRVGDVIDLGGRKWIIRENVEIDVEVLS